MKPFTPLLALAIFASVANATTHEYVVSFDSDMRRMQVAASFGEPVDNVAARSRDAGDYLGNVRDCTIAAGRRIRIRNRRMLLPQDGITCLTYTVDLQRAARNERRNTSLLKSNFIVSPADWLWRPTISGDDDIIVRFEMPDNVEVSVPWRAVAGKTNTYRIFDSPETSTAFAAFGQLEYRELDIPGASLRVTIMQSEKTFAVDPLYEWVRDTALTVNLAYGRFPNPNASVVLLPTDSAWSQGDAVTFGRVVRDGGETVELFINPERPIDEFYDSWTATHEFSHLMMPYVSEEYRWISEGFASYYQNVLMARAGRYTEQRAWLKLRQGFERGRQSRPEMSLNEAAREGWRGATMKIYWSGAVIALMADAELRQRSNGEESLDTVLGRLQACCLPSDHSWSGTEFFTKLDTLIEEPLFMRLYRRYANTTGFPEVQPLLDDLGVDFVSGDVQLRNKAELTDVRIAIMHSP
jgi:M61 glycyl aminopeptidase